MITLDTARKLKEAGLVWEPKTGDMYAMYLPIDKRYSEKTEAFCGCCGCYQDYRDLWLPRLDQILAEIEGRGYQWILWSCGDIAIAPIGHCTCYEAHADTPEEATGLGLLHILGGGQDA